jgi:hypothetical protein
MFPRPGEIKSLRVAEVKSSLFDDSANDLAYRSLDLHIATLQVFAYDLNDLSMVNHLRL